MSRNGSGTYSLPAGNPVSGGTTITSTWANATLSDIATALTQSVSKDGQTTWTGDMQAGGNQITDMGDGTLADDAATLGQVQAQAYALLTGVAGADTITASASPAPAAYAAGQTYRFVSAGANTGAVTLNVNSLGAKAVTKDGALALSANDILSGQVVEVVYDGTRFQMIGASPADSQPLVVNAADPTKIVKVSAANITTATTRTLTAIDKSGTVWLPEDFYGVHNAALTASVGANAITFALKTRAGADPSASDPVFVSYRNATLTTGPNVVQTITSALSMDVTAGATLGFSASEAGRIHVGIINNSGTPELCCWRAISTSAAPTGTGYECTGLVRFTEAAVVSTTAMSNAADSALTLYSTSARSNVAMTYLGFIEITTGGTAGNWGSSPTVVATWRPGMFRPGDEVQRRRVNQRTFSQSGAGAAQMPSDDTIPQLTEGASIGTQAFSSASVLNVHEIRVEANLSENSAEQVCLALFNQAQADALDATSVYCANTQQLRIELQHDRIAGSSSITYEARAGTNTAGAARLSINGIGAGRILGGVQTSYMTIREVWA